MVLLSSLLCVFMLCRPEYDPSAPRVRIAQGDVRGYTLKSRGGRSINAFTGIPYAKPPVGGRRFKDPEEPDPWQNELYAKKRRIMCVQFFAFIPLLSELDFGNEDCLYLSVYSTDLNARRPVIVYLHGGAYTFGSGTTLKGPQYFMDENVVIVAANYRLGILGFLSMEDEIMPGNYGSKDQVMVLKWVRNNIEQFGGDPDRVTVMGESAGGSSAHMMTLSPLTKGLVHRSISESGTALGPWAVGQPGRARRAALRLAELVNCSGNSRNILACLRSKSKRELLAVHRKMAEENEEPTVLFNPVVDCKSQTPFLPSNPWTTNRTHSVPWLVGICKYDGVVRTARFSSNPNSLKTISQKYPTLLNKGLGLEWTAKDPKRVAQKIWDYYIGKNSVTKADFENLTNMYGDAYYLSGLETSLKNHRGRAYEYYFTYTGRNSFAPLLGGAGGLKGPVHTDETIYLWYSPELFGTLTGDDLIMSKLLVKTWVNFAETGIPEPYGKWKSWNENEKNYIEISNSGLNLRQRLLEKRAEFWAKLPLRDKLSDRSNQCY